jgi:Holliday junction resolvase
MGHYVWRNNTGATRLSYTNKAGQVQNRVLRAGLRGSSDIIGLTKSGQFLAVECKVGRNKPTEIQNLFLEQVRVRGGIAIVAYDIIDLQKAKL